MADNRYNAVEAFQILRGMMDFETFEQYCHAIVDGWQFARPFVEIMVIDPDHYRDLAEQWIAQNDDHGYRSDGLESDDSEPELLISDSSDDEGFVSEGIWGGSDIPGICIDCGCHVCECYFEDTLPGLTGWTVMESEGNNTSKGTCENHQSGNFGTVINNYYHNTYQGSVDMSGVAAGDKPSNTLNGLVDSASAAFSAVAPMLLDQDTEEMTNLSDRVLTQTIGNSAINTQSTVGRMIGYSTRSDSSFPTSCGDNPTTQEPSSTRWYTQRVIRWQSNSPIYSWISLNLPDALRDDAKGGVFAQNLQRHYSLKSGWRAQVQCNASQFHGGALIVMFIPEFTQTRDTAYTKWQGIAEVPENTFIVMSRRRNITKQLQATTPDVGYITPEQFTLYPHQILNLRTGTSVDLEVPYMNITPTSDPTVHQPWSLVIAVLSPLRYAAGASPDIEVTVSVAPVAPMWNGLRQVATSEGIPTAPRENAFQFTTTIPDLTTPLYGLVKNRPVDYLAGEIKDLVSLAKIPCFMSFTPTSDSVAVPYISLTNNIPNTPIQTFNVVLSCRCLTNTMVGAMARQFAQYRGSLNYNFLFCGTAMMKAKVLIAYTPPGAGVPTTIDEAMQGTYDVWDIGLNSTWVFTVPFISVSDWRYTQQSSANALNADGWVTVWQLTPLTYPPGSPSTADVVVMASAGEDFSFRNPIYSGSSIAQGVDNAEKGQVADQDSTDKDGQRLDVETSHTDISFFFDRARFAGVLLPLTPGLSLEGSGVLNNQGVVQVANGYKTYMDGPQFTGYRSLRLGPHPSAGIYPIPLFLPTAQWDRAFWNFAPFTYFRADIEVTVMPFTPNSLGEQDRWHIFWTPAGAPLVAESSSFAGNDFTNPVTIDVPSLTSINPRVIGVGNKAVSFQIPWNSPQTVCSTSFNGFSNYSRGEGFYGTAPANTWGTLQLQLPSLSTDTTDYKFLVFYRYKNLRAWAPKPVFPIPLPAASRTRHVIDVPKKTEDPILESEGIGPSTQRSRPRCLEIEGTNNLIPYLPIALRIHDKPVVYFTMARGQPAASILHKGQTCTFYNVDPSHPILLNHHVRKIYYDWSEHTLEVQLTSEGAASSKQSVDEDTIVETLVNTLEATNGMGTLSNGLDLVHKMQQEWQKAKEKLHYKQFWADVVQNIIKFFLALYGFFEASSSGKLAMTALAGMIALEWTGLIEKLKKFLCTHLTSTPPPDPKLDLPMKSEGPAKVQEVNNWFNLIKNVQWIGTQLKCLLDWLKSWFTKEEETPQVQLARHVEKLPEWVSTVQSFRNGNLTALPKEVTEGLEQTYKLALACKLTGLATFLERFTHLHTHTQARTEPVVIVLRGKPGQGKSVAAQIIAQAVSKVMTKSQSVYSFPPDSKYFDGYTGQYCMIMDDLGQNPDGEDFKVFCQMVSTTHFVPNMASLDQKGIPFKTQLVIATTNAAEFRPVTVADHGAVQRRITYDLTVTPNSFICNRGFLDLEAALQKEAPTEVPMFPFTFNCPILRHLKLHDSKQTYTLPELVDHVCALLEYKNSCSALLNTLVSQGLLNPNKDPFLAQILQECTERIEEVTRAQAAREQIRADFMTFSGWLLAILAMLFAAFQIHKRLAKPEQPLVMTPKMVVVSNDAQSGAYDGKNVKKKEDKVLKVLDMENGNATLDFEVFCAKNVVYQIQFNSTDVVFTQSAIAICDRVFVTNAHSWKADWESFTIRGTSFRRDQGYDVLEIHKKGLSTDLVFVKLEAKGFHPFKNNVSKFADGHPKKNTELTGLTHFSEVPLLYEGQVITDVSQIATNTGTYTNCFRYLAKTRRGFCGSALIGIEGNSKRIYGMHSAGADGVAGACLLQKSMIKKVLQHFGVNPPLKSEGMLIEQEAGPRVFVTRKTQYRPTLAHSYFSPDFGPAALKTRDPRLNEGVDLDTVIFSKHQSDTTELPGIVADMAEEYANEVFTKLGKDNGILTQREAILGIDGLDKMDKHTSPGLPYTLRGKRREDLIDFESGELLGDPCLELQLQNYRRGDYSDHLFQTFLKDEIRPLEKVRAGKTRIVDVASLAHCIVGRQLLGRFCSKFHQNYGLGIGSAIGCDPERDWTKFYYELAEYKYVYDVDYSNFDASHGTALFQVLANSFFTPANGFDPGVSAYLNSLAISRHAYEARRFEIRGGLPSGCSSTSVINTVANNIVIRSGLALTYSNFSYDDVRVLAYGDDLLLATNFELDLNLLKKTMKKIGYKITPADKTDTFRPTSTLADVSFLKRRFKPDDCQPFLIRPLMDEKNLEAMVSFYKPGTIAERLQSVAILATHSGPEVYDRLFEPYRKNGYYIPLWKTMDRQWRNSFL